MKPFVRNDLPTIGVEQEYHLIDAETADLAGVMEGVRGGVEISLGERLTDEVFLCVLEACSPVARTPGELLAAIRADRAGLASACEAVGARLAAAGTHPFAAWQRQRFVDSEHYRWVRDHHGDLAHRLLSFGLHVHVGMRSAEAAIYAMHEMRRWCFPLLALSANSPFFQGRRTMLASTRWHLFGSMPRTGLAPDFGSFAELEALYEKLVAAGDITRPGDLWWVIRPQPPLGTLEFRIFDLPTDTRRVAALAAICQAACALCQDRFEAGEPRTDLDDAYLAQNAWKAMRYDLDAGILDAATGEVLTIREQIGRLLDWVGPKAAELGGADAIAFAHEMLRVGTETQWQVERHEALGGDLRALELEIAQKTTAFDPLPPARAECPGVSTRRR